MQDYGFIRVGAATPRVRVADPKANAEEIMRLTDEAEAREVAVLVFPELSITGYTCADLFGQQLLIEAAERAVEAVAEHTRGLRVTVVAGTPARIRGRLYNCAAVIRNGEIKALVPKTYIPTYGEFYESRWFASGSDFLTGGATPYVTGFRSRKVPVSPNFLFMVGKATFAVEICEDLWVPVPPSCWHALAGAEVIVNLSASNEVIMKHLYRHELVGNQSARTLSAYVYCSCGYGESTQDLVFAGSSMIYENGGLMAESGRFSMESSLTVADIDFEKLSTLRRKSSTFTAVSPDGRRGGDYAALYSVCDLGDAPDTDFGKRLLRHVEAHPFVPSGDGAELDRRAREITSMQVMGLATRLDHIHCKTAVIGISGGLDSTLALLITVLAFDRLGLDRKGVIGVTMPGFGTTGRTHDNASGLMAALGVTAREVSIIPAVEQHFRDIGQDPATHDVTYENSQARERTQILMDLANKVGGIVIGTGDLSELALGWCTYNGDHISMYGVNSSIPKTLVRHLVRWAALNRFGSDTSAGRSAKDILLDIADTPISPELLPSGGDGEISQRTEDLVGPYELHDFFLYNFFRFGYSPSKLLFLAKKAFTGRPCADGEAQGAADSGCGTATDGTAATDEATGKSTNQAAASGCGTATDGTTTSGKATGKANNQAAASGCGTATGKANNQAAASGCGTATGKANNEAAASGCGTAATDEACGKADAVEGGYTEETIRKWLTVFCRRFFSQQFKRSCLPDGPKVGSVTLSPRGDWRMPSDACATLFTEDA